MPVQKYVATLAAASVGADVAACRTVVRLPGLLFAAIVPLPFEPCATEPVRGRGAAAATAAPDAVVVRIMSANTAVRDRPV